MVSGVRVVSIRWDSVSVAGIVSIAAGVERIEELGVGVGGRWGAGRCKVEERTGTSHGVWRALHPAFQSFQFLASALPTPPALPGVLITCLSPQILLTGKAAWSPPRSLPLPAPASRPSAPPASLPAPPCCSLEWRFFQVPGSGDHFLAVCGAPSYAPESCPLLFLALPSLLISGRQKQGVSRLAALRDPQPRELGLFF